MNKRGEVARKWECGGCNTLHDYEYMAEDCCRPDVTECWECPACERAHNEKEAAESCCPHVHLSITCPSCMRDYDKDEIGFPAVEIAGHCQACNPFFSVNQQLQIEDAYQQETGKVADLLW